MTFSSDRPEAESETAASQAHFGFGAPATPASPTPAEGNGHSSLAPAGDPDIWPPIDPTMQPLLLGPGASFDAPAAADVERKRGSGKRRARRLAIELVETVILAALIFFAVRALAQNFRVEGSSMEPGLHDGQYLLVNKAIFKPVPAGRILGDLLPIVDRNDNLNPVYHQPNRGDVIVFRYPKDPSRDFIKRVIGVPGDTVHIQNGEVFVNNVKLEEPYLLEESSRNQVIDELVPPRNYFVLGDNRANSSDSRSWGFVPQENIIGQAMFTYWPFDELGGVGNHHIDLGIIKLPLP